MELEQLRRQAGARQDEERRRDHLAAIVESSYDAILSKDIDGTITSWNRAAEELFGYTAAQAIGQNILMLFPRGRENEEVEILGRILADQRVERFETVRVKKDGTSLDVSLTISPVKDATGRVIGASKIIHTRLVRHGRHH